MGSPPSCREEAMRQIRAPEDSRGEGNVGAGTLATRLLQGRSPMCAPRLLLAIVAVLTAGGSLRAAESVRRPNIVWILVDDMSANFSCYGEKAIRTPHVDALAEGGTRFA